MAKSRGRQKNGGGNKIQRAKGQPKKCDTEAKGPACRKRKKRILKKGIGLCLSCGAG